MKHQMTSNAAKAINAAFALTGTPMELVLITPELAKEWLKENPKLLSEYGLSQIMSGDGSEEDVVNGKGRKFVDTLIYRIQNDGWKWWMGILNRLENGAFDDGVTRLIAISKAGKPVWAFISSAGTVEDFAEFDDPDSVRIAKDVFQNLGFPSQDAAILSHIVPKAAGSVTDAGNHARIIRDKWYAYFLDNKRAFLDSVKFVKTSKGSKSVSRKNLTALIYFRFVTKGQHRGQSKRFLDVYKGEAFSTNEIERQFYDLAGWFRTNQSWLHDRIDAQPLFTKMMIAGLRGEVLKYHTGEKVMADGSKKFFVAFGSKKPRKARSAKA